MYTTVRDLRFLAEQVRTPDMKGVMTNVELKATYEL
jgi:hypothetical protein